MGRLVKLSLATTSRSSLGWTLRDDVNVLFHSLSCDTAVCHSRHQRPRHYEVISRMIHYTCDRCKRTINQKLELRYQIKMEVQGIGEPDDSSPSDDVDSLSELHQLLEGLQDDDEPQPDDSLSFASQYDLCPRCYRQFARNPLGRELAIAIGFSNN